MKLTVRQIVGIGPDSDGEYEHIVAADGTLYTKTVRLPLTGYVATGPSLLEVVHEFATNSRLALGRRLNDLEDGFAFEIHPTVESPAAADPIEAVLADLAWRQEAGKEALRQCEEARSKAREDCDKAECMLRELDNAAAALRNIRK